MKKQIIIILIIVFGYPVLLCQLNADMKLTRISEENGIPSTNISKIFEDSRGFIWFGTWSSGVYRYDGYSFVKVTCAPSNIENTITNVWAIDEDDYGNLWFAGGGGLYKYNPEKSEYITSHYLFNPDNKDDNIIHSVYIDNNDKIWIGSGHGKNLPFFDIEKEKFHFINFDPEVPDSLLNKKGFWTISIVGDEQNNIWFGTSWGLYKYNQKKEILKAYRPASEAILKANYVFALCCSKSDKLWAGLSSGLYLFDKEKEEFICKYKLPELSKKASGYVNSVLAIKEDKEGNIWFRSFEGLYRSYLSNNELSFKKIYSYIFSQPWENMSLCIDKSDNIWFGFIDEGINILSAETENFKAWRQELDNPNSLSSSTKCIFEDDEGFLWIGTRVAGLNKYDKAEKKFTHFKHNPLDSNSISGDNISYIYKDRKGVLWIGTQGSGLNKAIITSNNQIKFKRYMHNPKNPSSLMDNRIFRIFEDSDGNLWIYNGGEYLTKYDRKNDAFVHLTLVPDNINSDPEESNKSQGEFWFPHWKGISRIQSPFVKIDENSIKAHKITLYRHDPDNPLSMKSDAMTNTYCFSRHYQPGTIWFGTLHGLGKLIKNDKSGKNNRSVQFKYYTNEDGFTGNQFYGILEDNKGILWISTDMGLFKFDPRTELFTQHSFLNFFPSNAFEGFEPCKSKDGTMYFPHSNGLLFFNPDSMQEDTVIPPVYITDIKLFDKTILAGKNSLIKKPIVSSDEIKLLYNQNYLAFEYVALDYTNPERNQYRYKLEGLDEDWINAGTRRIANYSNLKHGKYIFRVQGSNNNGIWNLEGDSMKIIIKPPWWKTIVAFVSYIIITILIVVGFIKWRTRRLEKEKDALEKQVKSRTKEIQEANEELNQQKEELLSTLDNLRKTQEQLIESEKMASLGGLVAGVAHEINTPVGITITAASGLLEETHKMVSLYKEDKISRAEFKEYLNNANHAVKLIMSNMEKAATMVQSFKQISVDQSLESKRTFNLMDYTEDVIRSLYPKLKNRKITVSIDIDKKIEIESFPGAYSQVVTNLVLNSLIHGFEEKQEGKIDIKAVSKEDTLTIEYHDNGKGIAKENLKKIFDPFFTTNKRTGTGLGLHIVYNLVTQKLGGSIECKSKIGEGVLFIIKLLTHPADFR